MAAEPETNARVPGDPAGLIDHTLLKPQATEEQIRRLCSEALHYRFAAVCVNPVWVPLCAQLVMDSPVKVATVIGFPLGATLTAVKAFEAQRAVDSGAQELDMVLNIGALKSHEFKLVVDDIAAVVSVAHPLRALVKVIIEACFLTEEEKVEACVLAKAAGADYVKTSTGMASGGATVEDVALMRRVVGTDMGVKAAGGIRSAADFRAMVEAGATRIGTSAGTQIIDDLRNGVVEEKGED